MKKVIALLVLTLAGVFSASAQTPQTANEGYIGYSFVRQNVDFKQSPTLSFDENTDSHGVAVGYTRFLGGSAKKAGVVGLTGELAANFDSNKASLVTALVGVTLKARNNSLVQPYVRGLVGVSRQNVTRRNIYDNTDVSGALIWEQGLISI